ncbi:MAG: hypothetical protein ACPIOQ_50105 [Promethearchaeia archaeon]
MTVCCHSCDALASPKTRGRTEYLAVDQLLRLYDIIAQRRYVKERVRHRPRAMAWSNYQDELKYRLRERF